MCIKTQGITKTNLRLKIVICKTTPIFNNHEEKYSVVQYNDYKYDTHKSKPRLKVLKLDKEKQ